LDISFQHLFRHAEFAVGIQELFIQEKAVRAGQIAGCTTWLGENVNTGRDRIIGHRSILSQFYIRKENRTCAVV
jgi:hypothetical protein